MASTRSSAIRRGQPYIYGRNRYLADPEILADLAASSRCVCAGIVAAVAPVVPDECRRAIERPHAERVEAELAHPIVWQLARRLVREEFSKTPARWLPEG